MRITSTIPGLLLLLLCVSTTAFPICSHSRDCNDGNPMTLDFCVTRYSFCVEVQNPQIAQLTVRQFATPRFRVTTLPQIVKATNANPLLLEEKLAIVSATRDMLENVNPHKFLYQNLYNYNFTQRLDQLEQELVRKHRSNKGSNISFHRSMRRIFAGLNDYHTVYLPPPPIVASFAFLGFYTRQFYSKGDPTRRYVVNDIPEDFQTLFNLEGSPFREGVEILTYDGMPVDKAVKRLGNRGSGSNFAARIDNGVFLLSFRLLAVEELPLKRSVKVGFRDISGTSRSIDLPWMFSSIPNGTLSQIISVPMPPAMSTAERITNGVVGKRSDRFSRTEFGSQMRSSAKRVDERRTEIPVNPAFQSLFAAEILNTKAGRVGRLILASFDGIVAKSLVNELSRILKLMPERGLIIDSRRNPGGNIDYAKGVTELISDKPIQDFPATARATKLLRDIVFAEGFLDRFIPSLRETVIILRNALITALAVKEEFTGPMGNPLQRRPRLPRVYHGPVVSVVDGLTYSAADIFAALQRDVNTSLLVGTSDRTGAGGGSALSYNYFSFLAPKVLNPLPGSVDFLTAFGRFYRTGAKSGALVESFGVEPDIRYFPTYNDAVREDQDLFDFLGEKLVAMKR